jgi:polyferredoxin
MEKQTVWRTATPFARYVLAILFFVGGLYFLLAMLQSASYSVPAPPLMSEIYKTRAMLAWPIALLFFSVGVLFFIGLKPNQK